MSRYAYAGLGAAVIAVIGAISFLWPRDSKTENAAGLRVRTGAAATGEIRIVLNETGTVEPVRTVVVKSPISGTVRRLLVEEGDRVREGQLLAVVEPDLSQARAVAELRATYGRAEVALTEAERGLREGRALAAQGLISETEMATREAEHRRAQLELQGAQEQLRALEQAGVSPQRAAQKVNVTAPAGAGRP